MTVDEHRPQLVSARKRVAGAERTTTLDNPTKTLREAQALVQADYATGCRDKRSGLN